MHIPSQWSRVAVLGGFIIGTVLPSSAIAIRNAPLGTSETGYVFSVYKPSSVQKGWAHEGTAFNPKYPRCLVTAYHVYAENFVNNSEKNWLQISMENNPPAVLNYNIEHYDGSGAFVTRQGMRMLRSQKIEKGTQIIGLDTSVAGALAGWDDIAVIWLENITHKETEKRILDADYKKGTIMKANDLGVASSGENAADNTARKDVRQTGFGRSLSVGEVLGNTTYNISESNGTKRTGLTDMTNFYNGLTYAGNDRKEGSIIRTIPRAGQGVDPALNPPIACEGDSGGPLTLPNKVDEFYAVHHSAQFKVILAPGASQATNTRLCTEVKGNLFSAFNDSIMVNNKKVEGNYDITNFTIEATCASNMKTSKEGGGKIEGTISPGQDVDLELHPEYEVQLGGEIDCGDDVEEYDCEEYVHYEQTLTIEAIPDSGWRFDHWKDGWEGFCHCAGTEDEECIISEPDVGYYTDTVSHDIGHCVAVFVPTQCGDEEVDEPEECDEGGETEECDYDCTEVECGDHTTNVTAGEECDDGTQCSDGTACSENADCVGIGDEVCVPRDGDGCESDCTYATCGDGNVEEPEECDEGEPDLGIVESEDCDSDCTEVECGDSYVNTEAGEDCDDGNTESGDGCSAACTGEACGNNNVDDEEECDDGAESVDCNADCTFAECGDGYINTQGEECDDSNTDDDDGCDAECVVEFCGDEIVNDGNEECDDGNAESGDGCSSVCLEEYCGNNIVDSGEECDDGNTEDEDGCDASCQVELQASSASYSASSSSL